MFLACPLVAPPSSCHPCSHLGCVLLVPLTPLPHIFTLAPILDVSCSSLCCPFLILSPLLLPPWMCRARATVGPRLASPAPTLDVSCSPHCCPSLTLSPLLPSWMFLLVALLSLPHLVTLAPILDVSCSSPCCLSLILSPLLSARAVLGGFLPFVSWLTHSCHHCIGYHGNFLVVPLLRHHWRHCLCHHGHFFLLVPLSIHHGHDCLRHNFHFLPLMPSLTHHCHQCFFSPWLFLVIGAIAGPHLATIAPTTLVMSCCPLVPLLTFIVTISHTMWSA